MNIGIVSVWWNRGQGTVARHLRSIFDALGHRTFILARPSRGFPGAENRIATTDVWNQRDVTHASTFVVPRDEYFTWARATGVEAIFCDMNFQFDEIAALRDSGIRTVGRFVWETFGEEHVTGAQRAFSVIYSLTRCEQARYSRLGIESPRLQWGCHPELLAVSPHKHADGIYFFAPASYQGRRKPLRSIVEAFKRVKDPRLRLIIKAQGSRRSTEEVDLRSDPRIRRITEDCSTDEYQRLFSSCHVCLAPSRWEGLGLHLYEATAFGMPIITNDIPPMNEIVRDDYNGRLVRSIPAGQAQSGIPAYDPDPESLREAIESLSRPENIERMSQNTIRYRDSLSWLQTSRQFAQLLAWAFGSGPNPGTELTGEILES
jgi:glycosyltransferase involved in cell wall biosynthesis